MSNLYNRFKAIVGPGPLQIGEVTAYADGIATVTLPGGGQARARGETQLGAKVFIQDGKVIGPAPDLPVYVDFI